MFRSTKLVTNVIKSWSLTSAGSHEEDTQNLCHIAKKKNDTQLCAT